MEKTNRDAATLRRVTRSQDLIGYQRWQIIHELCLPVPWLALSVYSTTQGWYAISALAAFYFFLTGLRVTHNAFHYALGLPRLATDIVMFVLSVLMMGSHHAIQTTHIRHHRFCLSEQDTEGQVARQSWWITLVKGPVLPWLIHRAGWHHGTRRQRRWIAAELAANAFVLGAVWLVIDVTALKVHVVLMLIAYGLSAFFAVWTVHHDCGDHPHENSRTLRSQFKSLICYNMFYHIEHHLFPNVPTRNLPELSRRLDAAGYQQHRSVW
jgi:fatty acid desaturase